MAETNQNVGNPEGHLALQRSGHPKLTLYFILPIRQSDVAIAWDTRNSHEQHSLCSQILEMRAIACHMAETPASLGHETQEKESPWPEPSCAEWGWHGKEKAGKGGQLRIGWSACKLQTPLTLG